MKNFVSQGEKIVEWLEKAIISQENREGVDKDLLAPMLRTVKQTIELAKSSDTKRVPEKVREIRRIYTDSWPWETTLGQLINEWEG